MKRYNLHGIIGAKTDNPFGELPCVMSKDPNGEWVKWEDVEKTITTSIKTNDLKGGNMIELGMKYRDKITGFEGIATGHVQYISGYKQALLAPPVNDGAMVDSNWIDEQRLELVGDDKLVLNNDENPGFDKAAPKR